MAPMLDRNHDHVEAAAQLWMAVAPHLTQRPLVAVARANHRVAARVAVAEVLCTLVGFAPQVLETLAIELADCP